MFRLQTSIVIKRPIDDVWNFLTDPFNMPRWRGSRLAVRPTSPGPLGVGSTLQHRIVLLGLETRWTLALTEWDPPRAFAWAGKSPGVNPARESYRLEATPDGTKVTRLHEGQPRGIVRLLAPVVGLTVVMPLLAPLVNAQNRKLKRVLEVWARPP